MTPLQHLILWKIDHDLITDYERRYATVHGRTATEEDPTLNLLSHLFQHRTDVLAEHLGAGDWLDWFCWENEMGAKGLAAGVTSTKGKVHSKPIRTVKQLLKIIEASRAE